MSQTYIGVIVLLLSALLTSSGISVGTDQLTSFVLLGGQILGAVIALYGRYRLGGISVLGIRE